jgi:hypothetical protein
MKITINQLRKIIKEEVGKVVEGEFFVPPGKSFVPVKGMSNEDAEALDNAIEGLRDLMVKVAPELHDKIRDSIDALEELRDETDYGTEEEEEPYMDDYTDEESMYESRRRTFRKR